MREILFRGKTLDKGEWVYGNLITDDNDVYILTQENLSRGIDIGGWIDGVQSCEVIPESVGEYTGLKDKNGTRIFEGDIIKITGFHTTAIAAVKYGSTSEKSTHWGWYFDDNHGHTYFLMSKAFCKDYNAIIIGNIFDNPELLKGEN